MRNANRCLGEEDSDQTRHEGRLDRRWEPPRAAATELRENLASEAIVIRGMGWAAGDIGMIALIMMNMRGETVLMQVAGDDMPGPAPTGQQPRKRSECREHQRSNHAGRDPRTPLRTRRPTATTEAFGEREESREVT